jgi:hypothetical protein
LAGLGACHHAQGAAPWLESSHRSVR